MDSSQIQQIRHALISEIVEVMISARKQNLDIFEAARAAYPGVPETLLESAELEFEMAWDRLAEEQWLATEGLRHVGPGVLVAAAEEPTSRFSRGDIDPYENLLF